MSASSAAAMQSYRALLDVATREVFEIMLGCKLEPEAPGSREGLEFTAMVGLAGLLCGVFSLHCGRRAATELAAHMLKLPSEAAVEHAGDALGEVANVVAGDFKNRIRGASDQCLLSIPSVIAGSEYSVRALGNSKPLHLWYRFQGLPLLITLELHS